MAAQQALRHLQEVAKGPNRPVVYKPPEMIPQWHPDFATKLKQAVADALAAGVAADKVHAVLDRIAGVDLDSLPDDLLAACVEAGLGPDTDMGGESLLHFLLNTQDPIPLGNINSSNNSSGSRVQAVLQQDQQAEQLLQRLSQLQHTLPAQHHPACGSATLAELLRRGATPDLPDNSGNTALHMVVACMVGKKHFPDPTVQQQQQAQQPAEDEGTAAQAAEGQQAVSAAEATTAAAAGGQDSKQLHDNDAPRAAYAAAAFVALLEAGWDPGAKNDNGYSVTDLIMEGLARYQTELSDLKDPEGVAQTTVALLSQKAPEKGLQQFLDAKIDGVQAVVDALLLMHTLAATVERPRKARSAGVLLLVWLLLLVGCVWWMMRQ